MGKKAAGILVMVGAFLVAGVWSTYASIIPDLFKSQPIVLALIGFLGILLITVFLCLSTPHVSVGTKGNNDTGECFELHRRAHTGYAG
jgi:hypothetical protein